MYFVYGGSYSVKAVNGYGIYYSDDIAIEDLGSHDCSLKLIHYHSETGLSHPCIGDRFNTGHPSHAGLFKHYCFSDTGTSLVGGSQHINLL